MVWRPLGDSAWICELGGGILNLRSTLQQHLIPEIEDIVTSYDSISVHFNPSHGELVLDWLKTTSLKKTNTQPTPNKTILVPTDYHHPSSELHLTAHQLAITPDQLIQKHSSPTYTVAAIGFSPGFPYLTGLDPSLQLPRKTTPTRVPQGAVAIANNQAGIYPNTSFGGWHILGITNLILFQPEKNPPTLFQPGDTLKFIPTPNLQTPQPHPHPHPPQNNGDIHIISPGLHTTIQDLGRPGFRSHGITPGGATDHISARVANRLLSNPDHFAVLECHGSGPILHFKKTTHIAWLGLQNGSGRTHPIAAGETLDLRGKMSSASGIIAIHGGIDCQKILNSRSTDIRASFGGLHGRPLQPNDTLTIGPIDTPNHPHLTTHIAWPRNQRDLQLRFIKGLQHHWFTPDSTNLLRTSTFLKSTSSDRTATRLNGPSLKLNSTREMTSQPVVPGSIQIPPDGNPIILLSECQTIGGYPQIGHIISADIPALARALPGTRINFLEVSLEDARHAWHHLTRELALLNTGLSFHK